MESNPLLFWDCLNYARKLYEEATSQNALYEAEEEIQWYCARSGVEYSAVLDYLDQQ